MLILLLSGGEVSSFDYTIREAVYPKGLTRHQIARSNQRYNKAATITRTAIATPPVIKS